MQINFVDSVFFFYTFIGLYMSSLIIIIYLKNRKNLFDYPKGKPVPVSIVMPCYNEEKTIGAAIESLLGLDYPKNLMEIIVVDDKSKDNSAKIARQYASRYKNVRVIVNKRNSGRAAEPTNIGIMAAKYDYIAVADADSTPEKDALRKMIGFLQNEQDVAGVTCAVLARKPRNFMQKLQAVEYGVIAWTRKLLDFVDSVYVTPGPFAVYKKDKLIEIGLFDTKNMTQDIEIVWRMLSHGYKARMCLATRVYSETPDSLRGWFKQRIRWNIGGTQCILKYWRFIFRKGMFGAFIIPFFSFSLFLGLFGLGLFAYLAGRKILLEYLATKYSLYAQTAILRFQELTFAPSVLNFFGISLFFLGLFLAIFALNEMSLMQWRKENVFNLLFYSLVYLTVHPFIVVVGLYKLIRGNYSW